jgi:hypothetical protein
MKMTPQRLHADAFDLSVTREYQAYLQGALHDGTRSILHNTHRICQKGSDWLSLLSLMLNEVGHGSWIYQEGKTREVYVLETTASFLDIDYDPDLLETEAECKAYVRGYFDAEGGLPQSPNARFYVQFTQKDRCELTKVKAILESINIQCGILHNPSAQIDPDYWRFFVRAKSYRVFAEKIGSWHPRKQPILQRMMI